MIEERKNKTMKVLARDFGFDEALISWKTKDNDRFFNFCGGVSGIQKIFRNWKGGW